MTFRATAPTLPNSQLMFTTTNSFTTITAMGRALKITLPSHSSTDSKTVRTKSGLPMPFPTPIQTCNAQSLAWWLLKIARSCAQRCCVRLSVDCQYPYSLSPKMFRPTSLTRSDSSFSFTCLQCWRRRGNKSICRRERYLSRCKNLRAKFRVCWKQHSKRRLRVSVKQTANTFWASAKTLWTLLLGKPSTCGTIAIRRQSC